MTRRVLVLPGLMAVALGWLAWAHRPGPHGAPDRTAARPGPLARLGDPRFRHPAPVRFVALGADGRTAVTAADDATVRGWDAVTGRLRWQHAEPPGHEPAAQLIAINTDRRWVVAAFHFQRVVTLDLQTGAVVSRIDLDFNSLGMLDLSPDLTSLAGPIGNELVLWDLATGRPIRKVYGPYRWGSPKYSPDGRRLAGLQTGERFWSAPVDGSSPVREVPVPAGLHSLDYLLWLGPDRLITWGRIGLALFDAEAGRWLAWRVRGDGDPPFNPILSGGRLLTQAEPPHMVVELDPATLREVPGTTQPWPERRPWWRAGPDDGPRSLSPAGHAVRVADARTKEAITPGFDRYPLRPVSRFNFAAAGGRFLTADTWGGVTVWDGSSHRPLLKLADADTSFGRSPWLSPDGHWAAGTSDYRLAVWDATTGARVYHEPRRGDGGRAERAIGFDPAGDLWALSFGTGELTRRVLPSGEVAVRLPGLGVTHRGLVSPDGSLVAVGRQEGFAVRRTDPAAAWHERDRPRSPPPSGVHVGFPEGLKGGDAAVPLAFTPDGKHLIVGDTDWHGLELLPRFTVWDVAGQPVRAAEWSAGPDEGARLGGVACSPDGRRLAVWMAGATEVRVLETETWNEAYRFAQPGGVTAAAFTPDGRHMLIGHPDTSITVWDRAAIKERFAGNRR